MMKWYSIMLYFVVQIMLVIQHGQCGKMAASTQFLNPGYFSSNFWKFTSTSSFVPNAFNSYPYTFHAPMNKSLDYISSVHIVLTSWKSNTNSGYFGFNTIVGYNTSPLTIVQIRFGVLQNCGFVMIGFSVIVVSKPFHQFMIFSQYHMLTQLTTYTNNITLPLVYDYFYFLVNCQVFTSDPTRYSFIHSVTISPAPFGLSMQFKSSTGMTPYSFRYLLIIVDSTHNISLLNFYSYGYFDVPNTISSYASLNVNILYGQQLNPNCIIGFKTLKDINYASPELNFDLSAIGLINLVQNSYNSGLPISTFCIRDMKCPPLYLYRKVLDTINCYDCPTDGLVVPTSLTPNLTQTVGICAQFDPLFMMDHFDQITGISVTQCYTRCLICQPTYYFSNDACLPCTFTNCKTCSLTQCLSCTSTRYYIALFTCNLCSQLKLNCLSCTQTDCLVCIMDYFAINGTCVLGSTFNILGCLGKMYLNETFSCLLCDQKQNFVKNATSLCQCKSGFKLNLVTSLCDEICGDGLSYILPCDDGNTNQNDGCTNSCIVSQNFQCLVINYRTFCKSYILLKFDIKSIMKNQNQNNAILTLQATNQQLPFELSTSQFTYVKKSYISIQVMRSSNSTWLRSHIISAQSKEIKIYIQYNFTIEQHAALISLNTQSTQYIQQNNLITINTKLLGMNKPLIIGLMKEQIQAIGLGLGLVGILALICFLLGLLSRKFIGLQGLITLQLVHSSQLLISTADKWPIGFQYLTYLKYSFGYNQIIDLTDYIPESSIQRKLYFMQMSKFIIENYNTSFMILIVCFIGFILTIFLKKLAQDKIQKSKNENETLLEQKKCSKQDQQKQIQENLQHLQKKQQTQQISYRIVTQISTWCILQLTLCINTNLFISTPTLTLVQNPLIVNKFLLNLLQKLIPYFSFLIIWLVGLNYFRNLLISNRNWNEIIRRKEEVNYKAFTMGYLFVVGVIIGCQKLLINIQSVNMALLVFVIHFVYLLIVHLAIKPYRRSLKIHRYTLLINHIIYLVFLVYINLINFLDQLSQLIMVLFGYFLAGICAIVVVLTAIRLYYQYRYGQTLQIQVQKIQDCERVQILNKKSLLQQNRIQNFQVEAKKRQLQKGTLLTNKFSLQYQIEESKNMDLMAWLDKRYHWTKQEKEKYYFQKFAEKPLIWLQKQDLAKYKQIKQLELIQKKQQQNKRLQRSTKYQIQSDKIILKQLRTKMLSQKMQKQRINSKINKEKLKKKIQNKSLHFI